MQYQELTPLFIRRYKRFLLKIHKNQCLCRYCFRQEICPVALLGTVATPGTEAKVQASSIVTKWESLPKSYGSSTILSQPISVAQFCAHYSGYKQLQFLFVSICPSANFVCCFQNAHFQANFSVQHCQLGAHLMLHSPVGLLRYSAVRSLHFSPHCLLAPVFCSFFLKI